MKKTNTLSKNEKITFILFSIALLLFLLFLVFYHVNDMCFYHTDGSCGMKYLFHLYCPGCGGTRAIDSFLHGNFIKSFLYNPVILYLAVYFLSYYLPAFLHFIGLWKKKINNMIYVYILIGLLAIIIIHFVARNLLLVYGGYDYIGECIKYWQ